ncbi:MAG TPA: hypothetical protein VKU01_07495 [Bryobacteraceae bacterium]|nr:hypothetical protein [Bryobacteraceae bacterium]
MTIALMLFLAFADINSVKVEANPERRSELALENANRAIDESRGAYQAGDVKTADADLDEVKQSVELACDSLEQSGKQPRKSKYYKQAEIRIRAMLRRLASLRDEMGIDDRATVESATARLQELHDKLLTEIMSKKR